MREFTRAISYHCSFVRHDGNNRGRALEVLARFFLVLAIRRQTGKYPEIINITCASGLPAGLADAVDRKAMGAMLEHAFGVVLNDAWRAMNTVPEGDNAAG